MRCPIRDRCPIFLSLVFNNVMLNMMVEDSSGKSTMEIDVPEPEGWTPPYL